MHVADHLLDAPTSIATGVAATAAVAIAVRRSRAELSALAAAPGRRDGTAVRDRVLLAAATTGAVFALQMLNYPVSAGTSGHLMGGALAAAVLGPALGLLSVTAVLVVQASVFADGGLTALGTNVLLMAVVGTLVGWAVARGVRRVAPRVPVAGAAAVGGLVGVPVSAAAFAGLFAVGGTVPVPVGELVAQMVGVHALIGLGEAALTAGVVGLALAVAPGAVALAGRQAVADGRVDGAGAASPLAATTRLAAALGALATLAVVAVAPFAAATPDGLEATAERVGFAGAARDHALAGLPLADYGAASGVLVGVAGLVGVALCVVVVAAVGRALRPAPATA